MEYGLLKNERETVINYNDADNTATVSSSQAPMQRRLKKLAEEYPNDVKIKEENKYTLIIEVPKRWIKVRPPRKVSDEQRIKAAERLKSAREKYRMQKDSDEKNDESEN